LQPVLQPAIVGQQGFHEGIEGVVLVPVPVTLGAQSGEAAIPLPSSALQLLSPVDKAQGEAKSEDAQTQRG
jgi:hypothetical protein